MYWNSRLSNEHFRVPLYFRHHLPPSSTHTIVAHDAIADVSCGVGPFTIPALSSFSSVYPRTSARKRQREKSTAAAPIFSGASTTINEIEPVWFVSNDLNPSCVSSLKCNLELNKSRLPQHSDARPVILCHDSRRLIHGLYHRLCAITQRQSIDYADSTFLDQPLNSDEASKFDRFAETCANILALHRSSTIKHDGTLPVVHLVSNLPAMGLELLEYLVPLMALMRSALIVHVHFFMPATAVDAAQSAPADLDVTSRVSIHPPLKTIVDALLSRCQLSSLAVPLLLQSDTAKSLSDRSSNAPVMTTANLSSSSSSSSSDGFQTIQLPHLCFVRNVAPAKDMWCLSMSVPSTVTSSSA